jgi:hypothetical protein
MNIVVVMTGGGFEPGDIGPLLGPAIKSDGSLRENPVGLARLKDRIEAVSKPHASPGIEQLPKIASLISGRTYRLQSNRLDIEAVAFHFDASGTGEIVLAFTDGHTEERPVGLDGVERLAPGGRYGLPVDLRGRWETGGVFVLDYDEIANINFYQIQFSFKEPQARGVQVRVIERSTGLQASFEGYADRK